jgi:hypothetical protein
MPFSGFSVPYESRGGHSLCTIQHGSAVAATAKSHPAILPPLCRGMRPISFLLLDNALICPLPHEIERDSRLQCSGTGDTRGQDTQCSEA